MGPARTALATSAVSVVPDLKPVNSSHQRLLNAVQDFRRSRDAPRGLDAASVDPVRRPTLADPHGVHPCSRYVELYWLGITVRRL